MGVGGQCHHRVCVSETIGDHFDVLSLGYQLGGVTMFEVVESEMSSDGFSNGRQPESSAPVGALCEQQVDDACGSGKEFSGLLVDLWMEVASEGSTYTGYVAACSKGHVYQYRTQNLADGR